MHRDEESFYQAVYGLEVFQVELGVLSLKNYENLQIFDCFLFFFSLYLFYFIFTVVWVIILIVALIV